MRRGSAPGRATFQGRKVAKVPRACGPGPGERACFPYQSGSAQLKDRNEWIFSRPLPLCGGQITNSPGSIHLRLACPSFGAFHLHPEPVRTPAWAAVFLSLSPNALPPLPSPALTKATKTSLFQRFTELNGWKMQLQSFHATVCFFKKTLAIPKWREYNKAICAQGRKSKLPTLPGVPTHPRTWTSKTTQTTRGSPV